jgi:hypothetical protein
MVSRFSVDGSRMFVREKTINRFGGKAQPRKEKRPPPRGEGRGNQRRIDGSTTAAVSSSSSSSADDASSSSQSVVVGCVVVCCVVVSRRRFGGRGALEIGESIPGRHKRAWRRRRPRALRSWRRPLRRHQRFGCGDRRGRVPGVGVAQVVVCLGGVADF